MNTIKVIFVEPGKFAEVREIPASMETFKSILTCKPVSGQIKQIYPFEDEVAIVIDEDEKFNNTAPNRALIIDHRIRDILYGTFLVCGLGEENYESLSPELCDKYKDMFYWPERFEIGKNGIMRWICSSIF